MKKLLVTVALAAVVVATPTALHVAATGQADPKLKTQTSLAKLDATVNAAQTAPQTTSDRISKAVHAGRLTTAQAAVLSAKLPDVSAQEQSLKASFSGLTKDQKTAAIAQAQAGLDAWAIQHNVPTGYLLLFDPFN